MKRTFSILTVAAIALCLSCPAMAEEAPKAEAAKSGGAKSVSVIVVDVNKIMSESSAAKSVQEQVSSLRKALKGEVDKKESGLRAKDESLAKERGKLSADEFEKKSRAFQEDVMTSRKDLDARVGALDRGVNVAMGKIEKNLQEILFDMAKEQGANLVLPKAAILVAETSMDFTDQAMTKLNAKLPSVKVEVASASEKPAAEKPAAKSDKK